MTQGFEDLFEQALKLKENLEGLKEELTTKTVVIIAGEDEVKLVFNGLQEVVSVSLAQEELPFLQQQRLEMLLKRAINQGITRSREMAGQEVANHTGFSPSLFGDMF